MQTVKSNFLAAFENFWNNRASGKNNIAVILCGSAASWMIQNVVRNKGGLHNRITRKIPLLPFNLYETELFFKSRGVKLNRYQITQLYMAMGEAYRAFAANNLPGQNEMIKKPGAHKNRYDYRPKG